MEIDGEEGWHVQYDPDYPLVEAYYNEHVDIANGFIACPGCHQEEYAEGPIAFGTRHSQCVLHHLNQQQHQQHGLQQQIPEEPAYVAHVAGARRVIPVVFEDDEEAETGSELSDGAAAADNDDAQSFHSADSEEEYVTRRASAGLSTCQP
jgi:hypothetical protein